MKEKIFIDKNIWLGLSTIQILCIIETETKKHEKMPPKKDFDQWMLCKATVPWSEDTTNGFQLIST